MVQKTWKDRLHRSPVSKWLLPRGPFANRTMLVGLLVIVMIVVITLAALIEIRPPWLVIATGESLSRYILLVKTCGWTM